MHRQMISLGRVQTGCGRDPDDGLQQVNSGLQHMDGPQTTGFGANRRSSVELVRARWDLDNKECVAYYGRGQGREAFGGGRTTDRRGRSSPNGLERWNRWLNDCPGAGPGGKERGGVGR